MSSNVVPADELFHIIASDDRSNEEKLELITSLKTHVKKEFVDIRQVPKYLEALSIAVDISDSGISSNSFSVLCHLVKRVSMQDKSGDVLKSQGYLILPIIINRMSDSKISTIHSAKRALEACWLSTPQNVEDTIIDMGLNHRNSRIIIECIRWIHHIVKNINTHFKLNRFLPHIIKLLRGNPERKNIEVVDSVRSLLADYYSYQHNQLYKFDLERELEFQSIDLILRDSIMRAVASDIKENKQTGNAVLSGSTRVVVNSRNDVHRRDFSDEIKSAVKNDASDVLSEENPKRSIKLGHSKTPSMNHAIDVGSSMNVDASNVDNITEMHTDSSSELQKIMGKSNYTIDPAIQKLNVSSANNLFDIINNFISAFDNKETEFNWAARERGITKVRQLIRGNASVEFVTDLISVLKASAVAFCKAITSLRTTLCINGCQMVKECAILLKDKFDPLADLFLPTLIKICSATKNIASSNANITICAIFINISFTQKSLQRIVSCSNEKNVQPRSYSGMWLQILILRFYDGPMTAPLSGPSGSTGIEASCKILTKILGDPNPNVRQVAKDSFWCFQMKFPEDAKQLMRTLDTNIVKAIERSRPKNIPSALDKSTSEKLQKNRPSIREAIRNKYKETKPRRDTSIDSVSSSRSNSGLSVRSSDIKPFDRNQVDLSKRHASRTLTTRIEHSTEKQVNSNKSLNLDPPHLHGAVSIKTGPEPRVVSDSQLGAQETESLSDNARSGMCFDKQSDPILKFLSSNQIDLIKEGINLLKYAIMGEEDLSSEINELLRVISIREPTLLQPLFLSSEILLKRSYQFFAPEDFFRICTILIKPVEEGFVNAIIAIAEVDDIYQSFIKLLSYCVSISNVDDDGELSMQIIRFKSIIIGMIVEFMMKGLDKIPISDSYFSKITANMLELVGLVKSTELYSSFSNVLKKMYSINPVLFTSELDLTDDNTNDEVRFIIGIDSTLDFSTNVGYDNNLTSLMNLTKVIPSKDIDRFSPVKVGTDFTMIVPMLRDDLSITNSSTKLKEFSSNSDATSHIASDKTHASPSNIDIKTDDCYERDHEMEQTNEATFNGSGDTESTPTNEKSDDLLPKRVGQEALKEKEVMWSNSKEEKGDFTRIEKMDVDQSNDNKSHRNNKESDDERLPNSNRFNDKGKNVFLDPDPFDDSNSKFSSSGHTGNSDDLVDDFAQVNLGELSKTTIEESNQLQNIIEKVDPINKLSGKNRPIAIFHDGKYKGSPQKVKEYSYSDTNWFNFQVAKFSLDDEFDSLAKPNSNKELFEGLCHKLKNNKMEGNEFIQILNFLQTSDTSPFDRYFHSEGQALIVDGLLCYFHDLDSVSQSQIHSALIIMKQLFIIRVPINLESVWDVYMILLTKWPGDEELYFALMDTFDEMLSGIYSSQELIESSLRHITSSKDTDESKALIFALESLNKVLNSHSISLLVNSSTIRDLDEVLYQFLSHANVEVRRLVVLGYARLLKVSGHLNTGTYESHKTEEAKVMDGILLRCSVPQKKLIEYYSQV